MAYMDNADKLSEEMDMASNYLDDADLDAAAKALGEYIRGVSDASSKMSKAAQECNDNLGSDVLSAKAVAQVQQCAKSLQATIQQAQDLRQRITRKAQQIRDLNGAI